MPLCICPFSSTNVEKPLQISYFLCKTNPILSAVGGLQMNISVYSKMAYENKHNWTLGQNKPNSNPIKPNFQKAKMNVSSLITKDYRKKDDFAVRKNKPNANPIKACPERSRMGQFPSRNDCRINRRVFYFDSLCGFGYSIGCFVT